MPVFGRRLSRSTFQAICFYLWLMAHTIGSFACRPGAHPSRTEREHKEENVAPSHRIVEHEGARFLVFDVDLDKVTLNLWGQRAGDPQRLSELSTFLGKRGRRLVMATNAGIFGPDQKPLGLHVQSGEELFPINTAQGEGNFFLKPGGVFWLDATGAHVASLDGFHPEGKLQLATQSGPLLLDHGREHQAFAPKSTSLRIRSAVGVDGRGHPMFALSLDRVSFHTMATLFVQVLSCRDALYLDGEISALTTPDIAPQRAHAYAGLLVVTERAKP